METLTECDFQVDCDYDKALGGIQESFHVSYAIEMSKLAVLCMFGIFRPRFIPTLTLANLRSG